MTVLTRVVLVAFAAAVSVVFAVPAQAAAPTPTPPANPPTWQLELQEKSGTDTDYIDLDVSGGCPRPAHNILGTIYGHGFLPGGEILVGNTQAGVGFGIPFATATGQTLRDAMFLQDNPVPFSGTYRIVVNCRQAGPDASFGNYVADIRFTDAHNWVALPPVTTVPGPRYADVQDGPRVWTGPANHAAQAGGHFDTVKKLAEKQDARKGVSDASGSDAKTPSAADANPVAESTASKSNSTTWLIFGAGLLIAAGATAVLVRKS